MPSRKGKIAAVLAGLVRAKAKTVGATQRGLRIGSQGRHEEGLIYSRGFVLCRTERVPQSVAGWAHWSVGHWALRIDPRVPVDHAINGEREAWIIGDAFHPTRGLFTKLAAVALEADLLDFLDGTAGRFVLIRRDGSRIEIYHDAMGARSVFHGEQVVASHAALAAEVLGSGLRDWIIPFITSRGYLHRDVKYLPGLDSPYEGISQLTPNTRLVFTRGKVERYWPREPSSVTGLGQALASLTTHLEGLRLYLEKNRFQPIIGLSAGRDSRGVFAGLLPLQPRLFTFVRSAGAKSNDSDDSRIARRLAAEAGLDLEIVRVSAPAHLDSALSTFAVAFRQNTGYVRGNNSSWVEYYSNLAPTDHVFVRGFGGEVMRGFYPEIEQLSPVSLAKLYDVNSGSRMTRAAFTRFLLVAGWSTEALLNFKPSELFYWEHRMGVWGASALAESDMAFRTVPGYNSRDLFSTFMALRPEVDRTSIFESAVASLAPSLATVKYKS